MRRSYQKIKGMKKKKDRKVEKIDILSALFLIGGLQDVSRREAIQREKDEKVRGLKFEEEQKKAMDRTNLKLKQGGK